MLLSYVLFTLALVITPGSTTAVVVRNTLSGGRGAGLATAFGAALANTSHATAAGLGLALLLARWPSALAVVRVSGGVYLAWLGVTSLARAIRHTDGGVAAPATDTAGPPQGRRGFAQGLTVNLLNPAIATFYLVVVPSFVPAGASPWWFVLLAAIHVGMAFMCHGMWAFAFDRVRRLFHRPAARRTFEALTGTALIALAVRVLMPVSP